MRMSFVIKAGSRPQNLSWGMHAVTVTALRDTLESLLYLDARLKLTRDKSSGKIAYGTPSFTLGSFGKHDGRVKYVILEHLALFFFFSYIQVIYCHRHKHSKMQLGSEVLNISPRYLGADIIC